MRQKETGDGTIMARVKAATMQSLRRDPVLALLKPADLFAVVADAWAHLSEDQKRDVLARVSARATAA